MYFIEQLLGIENRWAVLGILVALQIIICVVVCKTTKKPLWGWLALIATALFIIVYIWKYPWLFKIVGILFAFGPGQLVTSLMVPGSKESKVSRTITDPYHPISKTIANFGPRSQSFNDDLGADSSDIDVFIQHIGQEIIVPEPFLAKGRKWLKFLKYSADTNETNGTYKFPLNTVKDMANALLGFLPERIEYPKWTPPRRPNPLPQLLHRIIEICIRERFVGKGEVPPLAFEGLEAVTDHGFAKKHAVRILLRGDIHIIRMALDAEPVEGATHVDLFPGGHIKKSQIHGGTAGMAAFCHDILLLEENALVQIRIEIRLHCGIRHIGGPADEMVHGALRTVGVVNLQAIAPGYEFIAHFPERGSRLTGKQRCRLEISVDTGSHEIAGSVVADFKDRIRNGVGQGHEGLLKGAVLRRTGPTAVLPRAPAAPTFFFMPQAITESRTDSGSRSS